VTLAVIVVAGALIGLSLGALGGGGSVLTVPALVYGLGQSAAQATTGSLLVVGITSLVVITITSASALAVRAGAGAHPSWGLVALLTAVAVAGGWAGARLTAQTRHTQTPRSLHHPPTASRRLHGLAGSAGPRLTHQLPASRPHPKENHHVPSSHLQEMRKDHLGRLRPARQPGTG
jgi:hypothetical protein